MEHHTTPMFSSDPANFIKEARGKTFRQWIETVGDPERRATLLELYDMDADVWDKAPASATLHQTWPRGLRDHLAQMCRWARLLYEAGPAELEGPWPFSWDSVMVAIFCHDAEKLLKYHFEGAVERESFRRDIRDGKSWEEIKWEIISVWEPLLVLSDEERNAVKYCHGEGADYSKDRRISGPLAALVGAADRLSGRAFYDVGQGLG